MLRDISNQGRPDLRKLDGKFTFKKHEQKAPRKRSRYQEQTMEQLFTDKTNMIFPFVENLHRADRREKASSLLNDVHFAKNNPRKQPLLGQAMDQLVVRKHRTDPTAELFKENDSTLPFGDHLLTVLPNGTCSLSKSEKTVEFDSVSSISKRSYDESDLADESSTSRLSAISISSEGSSCSVKRRAPAFKKTLLCDRIDNSMTISAKAILRMVDDSLVSSDTSLYSQSLMSISQLNSNVRSRPISIDANDLKKVLTDE